MKFDSAPIKKPFIGESIINGKVWVQWLTTIGDALKGEWSEGTRPLVSSVAVGTNYFSFQGRQVFVRLVFEDKSLSGIIEVLDVGGKPILFEDGLLNLYDGTTILQGVEVVGSEIRLPTLVTSGFGILTGTLVLKR